MNFYFRKKLKAFALTETIIAIGIIAVLAGAVLLNDGKRQSNSKTDQTEMLLRSLAYEIENYMAENGELQVDEGEDFELAVSASISEINASYSSSQFSPDKISFDSARQSFIVESSAKKDGFGSFIYFYGAPKKRIYILASPGRNRRLEFLDTDDAETIDDILVVMQMK